MSRSEGGPFLATLSSPGRGAIGIIRVWGIGALVAVDQVFRPVRGLRLARSPVGRLRVGRIGAGLGDEVVAVVVDEAGREVEIQCHGGPVPIALVVEALVDAGVKPRRPNAWARQASRSRIKGDAAVALGQATTLRAAAILLDQSQGALDDALRAILETDDPTIALSRLDTLIDRGRLGTRLVEGWRVVLAGRPNVGKSRLLNALAGYERAIVDPTPGTTRDVVTVAVALDGWPVELADTAGLRASTDAIEAQGVALARLRQGSADLVVVVLDRSTPLEESDRAILAEHPGALVVANKSDLPAAWLEGEIEGQAVSAERGDGVEQLVAAIAARLVPVVPEPGSAVPFRSRDARRLRLIRDRLASGDRQRAWRSIARWLVGDASVMLERFP